MPKIIRSTAENPQRKHSILWRFETVYKRGKICATMVDKPSWEMLRSRRYCKVSQYANSGISHGKAWEDSKVNRLHTLRISEDYASALKRRPGPKGRRSSRVLGATPDDSFIQSGQRPNGLPHQLRGEMNKLFQCEASFLQRLLRESMEYKPPKKKRVNLHMPDLSVAIDEVYREMIRRDNDLRLHPAFKRMWAPAICRLIELKWLHEEARKKKAKETTKEEV